MKHGPRSAPAQSTPPTSGVAGFPTAIGLSDVWYREHQHRPEKPDEGCWWFSSHKTGQEPGGRFDLVTPNGTCYLGETVGVAVRERCGRFLATHMPIPTGHMEGRVVSTVVLAPMPAPVADLTSPDGARFGVTGELTAGNDYTLTVEWAQALFDAGQAALLYQPRFTPGQERALAVFGDVFDPGDTSPATDVGHVVGWVHLVDTVTGMGYRARRSTIPSTPAVNADDSTEPENA